MVFLFLIGGENLFKWSCDLFDEEVKISQYTYIELAEWIIKCRQVVLQSHYNTIEEYQNKVYDFCMEWEKHYEENEKIYKGSKYKKALLFIGRKDKFNFKIDFGQGKEDVTKSILSNEISSFPVFSEKTEKIAVNTYNEDIKKVSEKLKQCFSDKENFKNNLNEIITDFYFNKNDSRIRVFKDNKWIKSSSYKEFLEQCEEFSNYVVINEDKKSYTSYLNALEDYDIAKTNYTDYMSIIKAEKAYDKKFFVNLAFALSLPHDYAQKLMHYNGYSFINSIKEFDIICDRAFKIGFGRDYVIALIDKYNADMKMKFPKFAEVQNITKTKKKKS